MLEFGENCLSNARINCELTIPVLRVHLPTRHYYEVIYNRYVFQFSVVSNLNSSLRRKMREVMLG